MVAPTSQYKQLTYPQGRHNLDANPKAQINARDRKVSDAARSQFSSRQKTRELNTKINTRIITSPTIVDIIEFSSRDLGYFNVVNFSTAVDHVVKIFKNERKTNTSRKLSTQETEFLENLSRRIGDHLQTMNSKEIARTAWGYATLGFKNEKAFKALGQKAQSKMRDFNSQDIANIAWAHATLGLKNQELFDALGMEVQRKIKSFNPFEIADTAWAFAKLGIKVEALFTVLSEQAQRKIKQFYPEDIAFTTWAFAKLGIKSKTLFAALSNKVQSTTREFAVKSIVNIAWGFATLGIKDAALFAVLSKKAQDAMKKFNPQDIANMAWAFATLGCKDNALFEALSKEAQNKIKGFNPQNIANTAWAYATLSFEDKTLFEALSKEAQCKIQDFNTQDILNTAWAFAVVDQLTETLLSAFKFDTAESAELLKQEIILTDPTAIFRRMQLMQVYLHTSYEKQMASFVWAKPLIERICLPIAKIGTSSEMHADVAHQLAKLGSPFEEEVSIHGLLVDIVIPMDEKSILIEVDGPSHFAHNTHVPLGNTLFKWRLLKSMNYHVVSIPYWEWDVLKDDEAKITYLTQKLAPYQ